jgi:cystathionine gamma-synthase
MAESPERPLAPGTIAVSAGRPPRTPDGPLNPPIVMASTYHAGGDVGYGRYGNPTWEMLESAVGALEGGIAVSFASGMAATTAVLDLVPDGGTVVAQAQPYYGTSALLHQLEERGRLRVREADLADPAGTERALDGAAVLWVESPTNPMLDVVDLPEVLALARVHEVLVVVDNTFATPVLQRPLEDGADVVVHSATKYLSGHSDLLMGVAVVRDAALVERLLRVRGSTGSLPGTLEAWLALRGLRTLHLRILAAQANARVLAERLGAHPGVDQVRYPGWGGMLSVVLHGDADRADLVVAGTRLWVRATSLGGVESSLERRRRWPGEDVRTPETLVRLSVGVEDVEDLWADLSAALDAAGA